MRKGFKDLSELVREHIAHKSFSGGQISLNKHRNHINNLGIESEWGSFAYAGKRF